MQLLHTTLGPLRCAIAQGDNAPPRLLVVLCHGYGAPGEDLVGLAPELMRRAPELAKGVRFVFPEAPLSLETFGLYGGRAWWHIDLARITSSMHDASALDALRREKPDGLDKARTALHATVEQACQTSQLPVGRVVLGGFSQGAMVTTDLAMMLDEPPAALCLFSGMLINDQTWSRRAPRRAGLSVFQSHGEEDPTLPFTGAKALESLLVQAGLKVRFLPFRGGHTIPESALAAFQEQLLSLL